jgi:hypothetical protein
MLEEKKLKRLIKEISGLEKMVNLFYCPECGSKNVAAIYSVPVGKITHFIPRTPPMDRCQSCYHVDLRGRFEVINLQKLREKK